MPNLTMFASATAQSAAAGERCCTGSNLIAFASLRRSKTWRPIRSIRIPPRIISARRAVYCHSGGREPDQGYGQSIFGACQTSIWVPSRSSTFTEAASRKFKSGHCRFSNRPLPRKQARCRQAQSSREARAHRDNCFAAALIAAPGVFFRRQARWYPMGPTAAPILRFGRAMNGRSGPGHCQQSTGTPERSRPIDTAIADRRVADNAPEGDRCL